MQQQTITFAEREIHLACTNFLKLIGEQKHIAFNGDMGVGKTTFITALCKILGTDDMVSSPTFAIVNEYALNNETPIYHFDFYRIKSPIELLDIGFDEYCSDAAWCFIEWPEKAASIIPDDFLKVYLTEAADGLRSIIFEV